MQDHHRKYKFALVGHSTEQAEAVQACFNPDTEELLVKVVERGRAVKTAQQLFNEGVEVIFGQMGTSRLMLQATGGPVVHIPRTRLDLIVAFRKAQTIDDQIGLSSFGSATDGMDLIEELLQVKIHQIVFNSVPELERQVKAAYDGGLRVIVGGGISRKVMAGLGGTGIISVPRSSVIERAFEEARAIAAARRQLKARDERTRTILQMVNDGVVGIDRYGRVDIYNDKAEQILGSSLKDQEGKSFSKIAKKIHLMDVLSEGRARTNQIEKIGGNHVVIDALPVTIFDRPSGAVAFLKEVTGIEHMNRRVKERLYKKGFVAKYTTADIKGGSAAMQDLIAKAEKYAATEATVLIQGETGTGKELVAQSIHNLSPRKNEPFVAINCAALPEPLLESELFGHEKGAFTGARRGGKVGLFELAQHGTVFLDEIADISLHMQLRLLRVIETKEVMSLGGDRYVPVDVRIISASHKDLRAEMAAGRFRPDLFFRLAVLPLHLPPLRERFDDVPEILRSILERYGKDSAAISAEMLQQMRSYPWPGNIRELNSFMESYLILLDGHMRNMDLFCGLLHEQEAYKSRAGSKAGVFETAPDLPAPAESAAECLPAEGEALEVVDLKQLLVSYEREVIQKTLKACRFNKTATAKRLGISMNTLWRKLQNE